MVKSKKKNCTVLNKIHNLEEIKTPFKIHRLFTCKECGVIVLTENKK